MNKLLLIVILVVAYFSVFWVIGIIDLEYVQSNEKAESLSELEIGVGASVDGYLIRKRVYGRMTGNDEDMTLELFYFPIPLSIKKGGHNLKYYHWAFYLILFIIIIRRSNEKYTENSFDVPI